MAAESNTVRRLRRLLAPAVASAALLCLVAPAGAATAGLSDVAPTASIARAAAGEPAEGIRISVAQADSTTFDPGAEQQIVVEIVNGTSEALAAGTLRLLAADEALAGTDDVDAWVALGDASGAAPASTPVGEASTRSLVAGSAASVRLTVPAGTFDAGASVVGLAAELVVDGGLVATGAGVFANPAAPAAAPVGLALAYPLTVPVQTTGLLPAERLETWTGPSGLLTRQLDAVGGQSVAIGVDPRIIASIRVLGGSAPASAVAWLERLDALPNEVFPLAYADADLAVQSQLGLTRPLEPTTFDDAIDPGDFADSAPVDAGVEATPMPTQLPDTEALLDWSYTRADLAWPADGTVAAADLAWFAASGLTSTILGPANVEPSDRLVGAASTIGGSTAVTADDRVTGALQQASAAASDTEWRAAASRLTAELALAASGEPGSEQRSVTLLATFDRSGGEKSDRVQATVASLSGLPWAAPATLTDAIGAPPSPRTLVDLPEDEQRRSNIDRMLQAERSIDEFSAVLADPDVLTGPTRRELLALLDVGWLDQNAEWLEAVGAWLVDKRATTEAVSVVPSSSVLVVASETGIPITVQNALPYAAEVVVDVQPTNGRLIVEDRVELTVDPESRGTVRVPVAAGVGNGEVTLEVSLTAPDGTPIGDTVRIPANVQADWEGLGAAILAAIAVIVFGTGIWRNIRRRRRQRAEAAAAAAAAESEASDAAEQSGSRPDAAGQATQPTPEATTTNATSATAATTANPADDRPQEDPRDG